MHFHERGLTVVFNGEIYNYLEIKNTLLHYGYKFHTATDTEVILKAYDFWGVDCFEFFNGMFAIAIWDEKNHELILARDHAGIKPLYYYISDDTLVFASEIRAFHHSGIFFEENPKWKTAFLAFGHLPEPVTTLKDVHPLEKGTALIICLPSLKTKKHSFFKWEFSEDLMTEDDAIMLVRDTIIKSVQRHMISDAPLGLFLSGGIDSSVLALIASGLTDNLSTLSVIFNEQKFSEEKYQQIILGKIKSNHQAYLVTKDEFHHFLPDSLNAMDQPSLDGINTYFISKYAKQHGLKAVLSGLGADELFGGYPSFLNRDLMNLLRLVPDRLLLSLQLLPDYRVRKLSYAGIHNPAAEYLTMRGIFTPLAIARIQGMYQKEVIRDLVDIGSHYHNNIKYGGNRVSWFESNFYMQNQLLKDSDYMSMWHGLEIRVPFLDKELMMILSQVKSVVKFKQAMPKYLLVKSFEQELPNEIWNRKKQGFTFPFDGWLKENEYSKPMNKLENQLYHKFNSGKLSWGRYWCGLLMNRFTEMKMSNAA
jgi:asparagine synthase (glutamine-hydrolysing)